MATIKCPGCGATINTETGEAIAGASAPPPPDPNAETDAERADRLAREVEELRAQLAGAARHEGSHEPPNV